MVVTDDDISQFNNFYADFFRKWADPKVRQDGESSVNTTGAILVQIWCHGRGLAVDAEAELQVGRFQIVVKDLARDASTGVLAFPVPTDGLASRSGDQLNPHHRELACPELLRKDRVGDQSMGQLMRNSAI